MKINIGVKIGGSIRKKSIGKKSIIKLSLIGIFSLIISSMIFFLFSVRQAKAQTTEELWVDGWTAVTEEWATSGTEPWIDASDASYIEDDGTPAFATMKEFTFTDSSSEYDSIDKIYVNVSMRATLSAQICDITVYIWDGDSWESPGQVRGIYQGAEAWGWDWKEISSILTTKTQVDSAKLYFTTFFLEAGTACQMDAAKLDITWTEGFPQYYNTTGHSTCQYGCVNNTNPSVGDAVKWNVNWTSETNKLINGWMFEYNQSGSPANVTSANWSDFRPNASEGYVINGTQADSTTYANLTSNDDNFWNISAEVVGGTGSTELWVDDFTNEFTDWTANAPSPYLDSVDSGYITVNSDDSQYEGNFSFTDSGDLGAISDIKICVYAKNDANDNGKIEVYITNSTGEYSVAYFVANDGSYAWENTSILATLPTWAEINSAQLRVRAERIGGADILSVDAALLKVDHVAKYYTTTNTTTNATSYPNTQIAEIDITTAFAFNASSSDNWYYELWNFGSSQWESGTSGTLSTTETTQTITKTSSISNYVNSSGHSIVRIKVNDSTTSHKLAIDYLEFNVTPSWAWSNYTYTIQSGDVGKVIYGKFYANDSGGNWNSTGLINITVSGPDQTPPTYSKNVTNTTAAGHPCNFSLEWDDNQALSPNGGYIFSTNNSGTWQNASWTAFTSTPQNATNTTTLNDIIGTVVAWCFYANDSAGNWNGTSCQAGNEFTLTTIAKWLEVNWTIGSEINDTECTPGSPCEFNQYEQFKANATVICKTNPAGYSCGSVSGSIRYNESGTEPNQLINITEGAEPFYIDDIIHQEMLPTYAENSTNDVTDNVNESDNIYGREYCGTASCITPYIYINFTTSETYENVTIEVVVLTAGFLSCWSGSGWTTIIFSLPITEGNKTGSLSSCSNADGNYTFRAWDIDTGGFRGEAEIKIDYIFLNRTIEAQNTESCGSLTDGSSCQLNWTVNATGTPILLHVLDVNFTSPSVTENTTDDAYVKIIPYGWLNATLLTPTPNQSTNWAQYSEHWINATTECKGDTDATCGNVEGTARYVLTKCSPSCDWPTYGQNQNRTGVSTSPAPTTNEVLWKVNVTGTFDEYCGPIVVNGIVYHCGKDQDDEGTTYHGWEYCFALNATTGEQIWNFSTGSVDDTPTYNNDVLFVTAYDKDVNKTWALNATNGTEVWSFSTGSSRSGGSPAVYDGRVFVFSTDDCKVFALNETTGDEIWNYPIPDCDMLASSPTVWNKTLYVAIYTTTADADTLYAFNATSDTAQIIWQNNKMPKGAWDSSPSIDEDGRLFIGGYTYDTLYAFWAINGTQIWNASMSASSFDSHYSTPAVHNGVVFGGGEKNVLYAINASNGASIWNYTTSDDIYPSPAIADGIVFFGSQDTYIYAVNETNGNLIWSYQTGGRIYSSAAVVDSIMYIASDDWYLYAFRTMKNISNETGDTPFYITGQNPDSCGSMSLGNSCQLNWTANATGSINSTYIIDVSFTSDETRVDANDTDDAYVKIITGVDNTPPTYSKNTTNTTVAGAAANFTINVTDDNTLDSTAGYIFSTNNTGSWENASYVAFTGSGTTLTAWNVTTLNDTTGTLVQWKFYANDTSNNWNVSETYNLTTVTPYLEVTLINPPSSYSAPQNQTFAVNASVYCRGGECGTVNGTAMYNSTTSGIDTLIPTSATTPFHATEGDQPQTCGAMEADEFCQLNWTVNATGDEGTVWEIGVNFSSTVSSVADNTTANSTVTITVCTVDISLGWDALDFGSVDPDSLKNANPYSGNANNLTNITNSGTCTLEIWIKGTYLENKTYPIHTIGVGNISWGNESLGHISYNDAVIKENMTTSYALVNSSLAQNLNVTTYYWLEVPAVYKGIYNGSITICGNSTDPC